MGFEPTTTGSTIRDSTTELRPPSNPRRPTGRSGAPGRTRTCYPQLRRLMLYPHELRARCRQSPPAEPPLPAMVGVEGFEPPTPCSQSRCATRLRYTPLSIKTGGRIPCGIGDFIFDLHQRQDRFHSRRQTVPFEVSSRTTPAPCNRARIRSASAQRLAWRAAVRSAIKALICSAP